MDPAPTPRKCSSAATTEAILAAARGVFTEKGYDGAGTREIAERAQVNVALISRYFGSKEGLFAAAIPPRMTLGSLLHGDMACFGQRVAAAAVQKTTAVGFDPMIALLRASSSPDAVPSLRQALNAQVLEPLAAHLSGPNRAERAALIAALIAGFDLVTRVLGLSACSAEGTAGLETSLAESIQRLVDIR